MDEFEWDDKKREDNLSKHGIDFLDAIAIFNDNKRIEAKIIKNEEERLITIGIVNGIILLVVSTKRSSKRRIISARRASKNERKTYHEIDKTQN